MPEPTVILGELAEEFTARVRNGQTPDVESYASQHPELAERIRELFPALMLLEGLAAVPAGVTIDDRLNDPAASLPPGTIFGQYRIVREIARGGMGIVYEAEHLTLHRHVALKVLPIAGAQAAKQLERFLREAKTAAGLHHTNIVPVFDVGQVRGTPYYAMQYIDGQSLDRVISSSAQSAKSAFQKTQTQITPITQRMKQVAIIGIQAAGGLAHAHERGVIHRDIKPSNLLLDDRGVVWITDFGLARRHDDVALTHSGQIIGTPRYMSPEQAGLALKTLDHRTDIYSLGATLYELLTRRPAFDGPTPQDVVKQIIAREPIRPRQLDPHVPRDLETVVLKAMAKRPEDRYPTAQALADDLQRFTNGEPIQARRIGIVGRTRRWAKREPVVAALVGAVMLSLLLGILVSGWYAYQANQNQEQVLFLLNDAAYSLGQRQDEIGEPYLATLWYVEPLKRPHLDPEEELEIRRRFAIRFRLQEFGEGLVGFVNYPLEFSRVPEKWNFDSLVRYAFARPKDGSFRVLLAFTHKDTDLMEAHYVDIAKGTISEAEWCSLEKLIEGWDVEDFWRRSSQGNFLVERLEENEAWRINNFMQTRPITPYLSTGIYPPLISNQSLQLSPDSLVELCEFRDPLEKAANLYIRYYLISSDARPKEPIIWQAELFACQRIMRGQFVPLSEASARAGWELLRGVYPDVFTVPIDDLLAWHLKEDAASLQQKHRHAVLFAANLDCRERPNDPHPFVARGRLFAELGDLDKTETDFAKAWQLGGTGWVETECDNLAGKALSEARRRKADRPVLEGALRKAEIANKYLPVGPHRWARVFARHRLGLPLDAADQATLSWLLCGLPMAG